MSFSEYNLRNRHVSQPVTTITTMEDPREEEGINNTQLHPTSPLKPSEPKKEDNIEQIEVIKMKDFTAVDSDEKLNLLMVAINKINTSFHHKFEELNVQLNEPTNGIAKRITRCESSIKDILDTIENEETGLDPRIKDLEADITDMTTRVDDLEEANKILRDQVHMLCGTTQVHDKQISSNMNKIIDLTTRSMAKNILISGIPEDKESTESAEKCQKLVFDLLSGIMKMPITIKDILLAH